MITESMPNKTASRWERMYSVAGIVLIFAFSVKLLLNVDYVMDVGQTDEAVYLTQGFFLVRDGLPSPQWAPLYAVWYYLLSVVFPVKSMVDLYYLSFVLLSSLVPVVFFLYLRRLRVLPVIALVGAVLVLVSYPNLRFWPYPTKFAALVFFSALFISTFFRGKARYTVLLLGLLAATYVRPEYFLAFVVTAALSLIFALWQTKKLGIGYVRSLVPHIALIMVCLLGAWLLVGNPFKGNRQLVAFKQHFSLNYVNWTGTDLDPWREANEITQTVFGDFSSLGQAIQNNPSAYARHLTSNAVSLWEVLANAIAAPYLPTHWASDATQAAATAVISIALVLSLIFSLGFLFSRTRDRTAPAVAQGYGRLYDGTVSSNRSDVKVLLLALAAIAPTILVSTILVYPREHYFQILAMLLIACWAVVVSQALRVFLGNRLSVRRRLVLLVATGLLLLFLMPNLARGWQLGGKPYHIRTDIRSTLELLYALDAGNEARFLTHATNRYSFAVYLADNFVKIPAVPKSIPFDQLLQDEDLDIIIWPERIGQDPSYEQDDTYQRFVADPAAFGFAKLMVPWSNNKASVLVKDNQVQFDLYQAEQLIERSMMEAFLLGLSADLPAELIAKGAEAEQLAQSGQLDAAIGLYRELADLAPGNRALRMQYAAALDANGQFQDALSEYQRIIEQWPDSPWPYVRRGDILLKTDDMQAAIDEYRMAVRVAPYVADTHFSLARALVRSDNVVEAIRVFEAGLEIDPTREAVRATLERLKQQQEENH